MKCKIEDGCYLDIQETHHIGVPYRTLTQDVSLYVVAITENTMNDSLRVTRNTSNNREGEEDGAKILDQNIQVALLMRSEQEHGKTSGPW